MASWCHIVHNDMYSDNVLLSQSAHLSAQNSPFSFFHPGLFNILQRVNVDVTYLACTRLYRPAPGLTEDQNLSGHRWLRGGHTICISHDQFGDFEGNKCSNMLCFSLTSFISINFSRINPPTLSSSLKLHANRLVDVFGQVEDALLFLLFFILHRETRTVFELLKLTAHKHSLELG